MEEVQYREELCTNLARIETIVTGLSESKAFKLVCEDVKKNIEFMDKNWHLIPEGAEWEGKIKELRLSKMASEYITRLIDNYKFEEGRIKDELFKLDNPDTVVNKDYDPE